MSEPEHRTPPAGAVALAAKALQAAIEEDWPGASAAITQVSSEYGDDGVYTLIYGVCDALVRDQGGAQGAVTGRPVWVQDGTDDITGAEAVPPDVAWAGQFIAARAAMDHQMCAALLGAIPDDRTFSRYMSTLVHSVALSLRNGKRLEALRRKARQSGG